jgi:hypothetical protein
MRLVWRTDLSCGHNGRGKSVNILLPIAVIVLILGIGLVMLFVPSLYLNLKHTRETFNPKLVASAWYRVQLRILGLFFTMLACGIVSGEMRRLTGASYWRAYSDALSRMLLPIFWTVWIGAILLWLTEKTGIIRPSLKDRYDSLSAEADALRVRKETKVFAVVLAALLLLIAGMAWRYGQSC